MMNEQERIDDVIGAVIQELLRESSITKLEVDRLTREHLGIEPEPTPLYNPAIARARAFRGLTDKPDEKQAATVRDLATGEEIVAAVRKRLPEISTDTIMRRLAKFLELR